MQAEVLPPVGHEPLAPMIVQVIVNDDGQALVPHPFIPRCLQFCDVDRGICVAWSPALEIGGILLSIFGGNPEQPSDRAVVATISREGLREIIADLQSIDAQLGDW